MMVDRAMVLEAQDRIATELNRDTFATGSALMYGTGADLDIVVLDEDRDVWETLEDAGYELPPGFKEYPDQVSAGFFTCRKGDVNLIVVHSRELFDKWAAATLAALRLKDVGWVLDKAARSALFAAIVGPQDYLGRLDERDEYIRN